MIQYSVQLMDTPEKIGEMGEGITHQRKVGAMKYLVCEGIQRIRPFRHGVNIIVIEFFHDHNGSVADAGGPMLLFLYDIPEDLLGFQYLAPVAEGVAEILIQPVPAFLCLGKIQFMEYRELFFRMEDRKVVVCGLINYHKISPGKEKG